MRDDDAQKAFSKLAQFPSGHVFLAHESDLPGRIPAKTAARQAALVRETEFAFKQAFAFCPYSPEAVFRYVNFMLQMAQGEESTGHPDKAVHYFNDAILILKTCQKLDPDNTSLGDQIDRLENYKTRDQQPVASSGVASLVAQANALLQAGQTNQALALFDQALANPNVNVQEVQSIAYVTAQLRDFTRLGTALHKMVALAPDHPEARCDLAALEAITGHATEALSDLKIALDLSAKRRAANPNATDLFPAVRDDIRFASLRSSPEFQKLLKAK